MTRINVVPVTSPYSALVERALKTDESMQDWLAVLRRTKQREDLFKDLQKDLRRKYGKNTTMAGPFCEELWLIVDKRLPRIMINQVGTIEATKDTNHDIARNQDSSKSNHFLSKLNKGE